MASLLLIITSALGLSGNSPLGIFLVPLLMLIFIAALIIYWNRKGFSPRDIEPSRQFRFKLGHTLMLLPNLGAMGIIATVIFFSIHKGSQYSLLLYFLIPVFGFGMLLWPTGLFLVTSAKRT